MLNLESLNKLSLSPYIGEIKVADILLATLFFLLTYYWTYNTAFTAGEKSERAIQARAAIERMKAARNAQEGIKRDMEAEINVIIKDTDGAIPAMLRNQLERMYARHGNGGA